MAKAFISSEELERAISTVIQYLRDAGFTGALEDGTGLADVVLKPNAMLYSLFSQLVEKSEAYLSLAKAQNLYAKGTITKDEYDDAVDGLMSNWFATRNQGEKIFGSVRFGLLLKPAFVAFTDGDAVAKYNNVTLVADGTQAFSEGDGNIYAADKVSLGDAEYYFDVRVRSNSVTDEIILDGATLEDATRRSDFSSATALGDFTTGADVETSDHFINRTKEAITTRELVTARAIQTVLLEKFINIRLVYVAGFGSDEQMRDITTIDGITVNYGGKADIYIKTDLSKHSAIAVPDDNGKIDFPSILGEAPFAALLSISNAETGETLNCDLEVNETEFGSVRRGITHGTLSNTEFSGNILIEWIGSPVVNQIDDFVYSDDQRVMCYDPLVRHMFPVVLRFDITVIRDSDSETEADEIKKAIAMTAVDYTAEIDIAKWSASALIHQMHLLTDIGFIKLPVSITASLQDPATGIIHTINITNKIDLEHFGELSRQISGNTVQPYTHEDFINVTVENNPNGYY